MNYHLHIPQYVENSAGIRAMHYLAKLLNLAGYIVTTSDMRTLDFICLALPPDTVCIYPDCVGHRNPRHAKRIIRFMCAPINWPSPGFYGGGKILANEMVLCFDEWYMKELQDHCASEVKLFPIPCIEPDLFWPEEKTIIATCYVGKSKLIDDVWGMEIITRTSHTRLEAASLLRKTRSFFTLDHYTTMAHEAELCGCKVFKMFVDGSYSPYETNGELYLMRRENDVMLAHQLNAMALQFFKNQHE